MVLQVTSFGSSNLLERRAVVQGSEGLMNQAPTLTSTQLEMNQISDGFTKGASDWRALASMSLGGFAFKLGKLATMGAVSSTMAATGMGLLAEVVTFRTSESLLHGQSLKGAFEGKGFASTALSFGLLKGSGSIFRNQNQVLAHTLQSATMVVGHELGARLKLVEAQSGNFTQRLINAEVMNIQMQAGASLVHVMLPGLSMREKALDLAAQSFLLTKERLRQNSGLGETLPLMASEEIIRPEDKVPISGSKFVMGSQIPDVSSENETPHFVELSPFKILRTPFTNAMLMRYWGEYYATPFAVIGRDNGGIWRVAQRGRTEAELQTWIRDQGGADSLMSGGHIFARNSLSIYRVVPQKPHFQQGFGSFEQPAVNINRVESVAIANAMGGHLPTEAQWELAARGSIVNVTGQMSLEGVPLGRFADFVRGPVIEGLNYRGSVGRYENFVALNPTTMEMGTEIFTDPNHARVQAMLRDGQTVGAWRVFSTASGAFEERSIWSSVTRERFFTRPVMEGSPGPYGLIDMNGNVLEWTNDVYGLYETPINPGEVIQNPTGPTSGKTRVLRGGAFNVNGPRGLRTAGRNYGPGDDGYPDISARAVFP